jgi:hypothetical protein
MARTKISEFSATPGDNTDIDGIDIAEGCAPSGINNAIRELMAQLKDMQTGSSGDTFTFANFNVDNINVNGNTVSSTDTNGNINLTPNGTGSVVVSKADINGGTVDGTAIGGSSAAAGAFTTLSATGQLTSTVADGTAPMVVTSTTKVANLNVDKLDGADWAAPAALGSTTPAAATVTTITAKKGVGTPVALTSSSASIAVDMSDSNFTHTFTENTTLANPTNLSAGQSGVIVFTQHASSPKTLAFGSYWDFPSGTVPTVTASNSAVDVLAYYVNSSTSITAKLLGDVK